MERYLNYYNENEYSLHNVIGESLLQTIDCMSYEQAALVSEYVMKLEEGARDIEVK